ILPQSQKLEEQLVDQLIEWPRGGNSYFIPIDQQKRLVTPMSIMEELRRVEDRENQHSKEELDDTTAKISNTARKMFSILVCLGKGKCIYNFLKEGLTDDHLPFSRFVAQATSNGTGVRTKLCSHRSPGKPIKSMANWSWNETTGFARDQWWMLAPVFKESLNDPRKVRHYNLDDNCVMPFIEDHERTDTIASGFSTVWAVRVHPAHQSLHSPDKKNPNPLIALKKLNSIDENDFRLEVEMLKAFSNHKDRHLIKLLATYRIKNRYHLMFPHCKYNLRTYWEANPKPKFTYTNVRWFLAQCKGIAHGLMTIHEYKSSEAGKAARLAEIGRSRLGNNLGVNPIPVKEEERIYGRHGDIKPENILWSDESESGDDCASSQELEQIGILVIADFGLMDFHGKQSRSMVQADVPASPTYAPPELRLRKSISRAYDIWSLGCLYLEFVTWLVCWLDELDKFPHARALTSSSEINDDLYYTIIEEKDCAPRAIVKESVTEWIQDLHEKPRCSQFIHDFVDLIGEMLVVDQNQRIHCGPLNSRLHEMCMKAKNDHGYLTDLIPRRPRAGDSTATEGSPTSPTASQGDLLRTKSQIPADLDTTTKSPKTRAAIPSSSRPVSYVRLRSPSPAGLRSSSPAPSIFLTEVDQKENTPSQRLGDDT
ncbi:kinase-like protein, partial [Mollisia scopiformis]